MQKSRLIVYGGDCMYNLPFLDFGEPLRPLEISLELRNEKAVGVQTVD